MLKSRIQLQLLVHRRRSIRADSGASLIEILVAILLVAFGMTAMASMLSFSINANSNAGNRALATMLANEYAELVRSNAQQMLLANPIYVRNATYTDFGDAAKRTVPTLAGTLCVYPACTSNTLATRDVAVFSRRLRSTLPAGDFTASSVAGGAQLDIWVFWMESRGVISAGDADRFSDNCPSAVRNLDEEARPRCLYMRVSL